MTDFEGPGGKSERSTVESPQLTIELDDNETYTLTWFNTILRCFEVGEGSFDHVVIAIDDKTVLGIKATEEIKEVLLSNHFPHSTHPYVDEFAEEVIATYESMDIDYGLSG